ncbi:hypothetical protein P152DRAFT_440852 [Eremomyces bilateralis CBS 781.70]|uniref:Glycosyl transferase CAP10 domain-containing protein n=1 Tax=Eremomyces bilateralis CBS 781.70 TaxID=1392243 RepID=A0A6G1FW60_9PEZI|nr:uncharacterized protein P152DRAFT_440852 [Eremomyces bilateralis CBS 781.70]KAF1809859.1 hypothetical protein P152DRAFT_440852 [Eremomyces bilateralis CBS 781.70]
MAFFGLSSRVNLVFIATAVCIVSNIGLRLNNGFETEMYSEFFCWTLLSVLWQSRRFVEIPVADFDLRLSPAEATALATGISASSLFRGIEDVGWISPLLTLSLMGYRLFLNDSGLPSWTNVSTSWLSSLRNISNLFRSFWTATPIAIVSSFSLLRDPSGPKLILSMSFLASQLAIYIPITRSIDALKKNSGKERLSGGIRHVGLRVLLIAPVLALSVVIGSRGAIELDRPVVDIVEASVLKVLSWASLLYIVNKEVLVEAATIISTVSFCAAYYPLFNGIQALYPVVPAVLALYQIVHFATKSFNARHAVFIFVLLLCLGATPYITHVLKSPLQVSEHPIEILIQKFTEDFSSVLTRQSSTVEEARQNYRARYGRSPPEGFDGWVTFALERLSPLIDDFDSIDESLRPYWKFSGAQLRTNLQDALTNPDSRLMTFSFKEGLTGLGNSGWIGNELDSMLRGAGLPDLQMTINQLDEPRVLLSREPEVEHDVQFFDSSRTSNWDLMVESCEGVYSPSHPRTPLDTFGLPFVQHADHETDLCRHPEFKSLHGFLDSPETFIYTNSAVPVFSQAKPSTFSDILYPSPFYSALYSQGHYNENDDPPWSDKKNRLYWAGSTTGSHQASTWKSHHRQRFIALVNSLDNSTHTFLIESKPGNWVPTMSHEIFSQLYDAKFTDVIQCEGATCDEEKGFFHLEEREGYGTAFKNHFLFDLDGNSFSGRYYTLLRSRSAVLKQTIFREWHDDRLVPWVHYIPISLSLHELPEVMRYFALTDVGIEAARKIAEQGREWQHKALRLQDMSVYLYRLLLEYARLLDTLRPAGEYDKIE